MQSGAVVVTVEVPAAVAGPDAAARARRLLILDAVRAERITWRAGARELGLDVSAFLDLARELGIPVARYDMDDWVHERGVVERLGRMPAG